MLLYELRPKAGFHCFCVCVLVDTVEFWDCMQSKLDFVPQIDFACHKMCIIAMEITSH